MPWRAWRMRSRSGRELADKLSQWTMPAERELIINLARVIRVTRQLPMRQQAAIRRCVDAMCHGMHQFQRTASVRGLDTVHGPGQLLLLRGRRRR